MEATTGSKPSTGVDLMVIGAGVAGCAAAITARLAGLRVVVIERLRFPRHRPGESLPPGVEPLFRQLGVWKEVEEANFLRYLGHRVAWDGEEKVSTFGGSPGAPWLGLQALRPVLDSILLQRARGLGAEIRQPCRALYPLQDGARVIGVATEMGEVCCRYVIDATGNQPWLPRHLNCHWVQRSPQLLASYGYFRSESAHQWSLPVLRSTSTGWDWMAQIGPDLAAWTRLSFLGERAGPPSVIASLPDARPVMGTGSCSDVTWRVSERCAGQGWFLAGDAALVLDPACSHGVLRGLMTGIKAAHLIAGVCAGVVPEPEAAATYQNWVREWFEHDAATLASFYRQLPARRHWAPGASG